MSEFNCSSCKRPESVVEAAGKYIGCAPLMSDGRLFTNWAPRCAQAYTDMQNQKPLTSYAGRQMLIKNAETIMKQNAGNAYMNARCGPCYENPDWNTGTMLPELNMQTCDANVCTFAPNNKSGLGIGRQYWNPKMDSEYQQRFLAEKEKEQRYFKEQLKSIEAYNSTPMQF